MLRHEVALAHLELGWADLLHAIAAEAHQVPGIALVDHETEVADRPRPVGTGCKDVLDTLLGERQEIRRGAASCARHGSEQVLIDAVFFLVLGRLSRCPHRRAYAWLIAVLDHEFAPCRKSLLPVMGGLQ